MTDCCSFFSFSKDFIIALLFLSSSSPMIIACDELSLLALLSLAFMLASDRLISRITLLLVSLNWLAILYAFYRKLISSIIKETRFSIFKGIVIRLASLSIPIAIPIAGKSLPPRSFDKLSYLPPPRIAS